MNEERKNKIMMMFTNCPIVSTENVALFFQANANPSKRASWALKQLEEDKLVEGQSRRLGETKLWRLTRKARKELPGACRAVSFSTHLDNHYIQIAHIWHYLQSKGELIRWVWEPRYPFGEGRKYCPDIFFALRVNGKVLFGFIEVQITPMVTKRWAEKWAVASAFFDSPAFSKAAFQDFKNSKGEPIVLPPERFKIYAISTQQIETITAGSRLPLVIARNIQEAPLI